MAKINDQTTFPATAPAVGDHFPGTDISNTGNDANGETVTFTMQAVMDLFEANMTVPTSVSSAYRTSTILSSTSNAEGASLIGIEDAGTLITATTVEGALAENRAAIDAVEALMPSGTVVGTTDSQALSGKTIDGDSNTISNIDLGNEADWAAIDDVTTASAFASGDKVLIFEAGVGMRKIDYDDLPGAGGGLSNIVEDTTPQLGGSLDVNGQSIVSVTDGDITLAPNGTGNIILGTVELDADQVLGAGTDNYVLTYDNGTDTVSFEAATGGGDAWGDVVDADILPTGATSTYDIGSATATFAEGHFDAIYLGGTTLDGTTLADPGADRLLFWDDSETTTAWLTVGAGLSISTTTLTATPEGTAILSTGEAGASKFLREDGDGTSSWQTVTLEGTAILSTGEAGGTKYLREDGDGTCSWQTVAGGGDVSKVGTPVDGQIGVWTGDGTIEGDASLTFDTTDDTLVIAASGKLGFGAVDILSDSAGTTTLQNIDALDATTEATIEAAIDTLANLTSIQGNTVTLTGDFIRSGAHSLTLTTGATTNVTLPASGTLAAYGDTTANFTGTLQNGGSNVLVASAIGSTVQAYDADTLKADTADQLTAGFTAATDDDSTAASPYTPDHDTGNYKRVINDGAMTINGPTMASGESTSMVILLTNTTGAGAITFGTTTDSGDTIGTTTTDEYLIFITAVDVGGTTYSHASVKALQ